MRQLGTILVEMESVVNGLKGKVSQQMLGFVDQCHDSMVTRLWYDSDQKFIDELSCELVPIYESIMGTPELASEFYDAMGLMVEFVSTMKVLDRTY